MSDPRQAFKEAVCSQETGQSLQYTNSSVGTSQGARSKKLIADLWPVFTEAVLARLAAGAEAYGDKSLDADPAQLMDEIQQELLDVMGWGFILWSRMERIKKSYNADS